MGAARTVIVGLGTCALITAVLPAQAQTGAQRSEPATFAKADPRSGAGGGAKAGGAARVAEPKGPPTASPAARPADPRPAAAAVAAVASTPAPQRAAPPASLPSGLSADAPAHAPSVGVVGGGSSKSGPSPAATPEPSTLLLMGAGIAGLYGLRRRR